MSTDRLSVVLLAAALSTSGCGSSEREAPRHPETGASPTATAATATTATTADADPFPASGPESAWFVIGWDATAESAEGALRKAGIEPARDVNPQGGFTSIKAERGDWKISLYFDASGKRMNNVVVMNSGASREIGEAAEARLRKRLGAPSSQLKAVEQAWRRREGEAASASGLAWGMTPPKAEAALKSAGFEPKGATSPTAASFAFAKGDRSGTVSFSDGEGLTEVVMRCEGQPRFEELDKTLGRPRSTTRATVVHWTTTGGEIELVVEDKMPGGAWTVRETYARKKRAP